MLNYNYNYVIAIVIVIDACNCVIRNVIEVHLRNILPCIILSNKTRPLGQWKESSALGIKYSGQINAC